MREWYQGNRKSFFKSSINTVVLHRDYPPPTSPTIHSLDQSPEWPCGLLRPLCCSLFTAVYPCISVLIYFFLLEIMCQTRVSLRNSLSLQSILETDQSFFFYLQYIQFGVSQMAIHFDTLASQTCCRYVNKSKKRDIYYNYKIFKQYIKSS